MEDNNILRHVKTHSKKSEEDNDAVAVLKSFLRSDGKINMNFASNDKWPNTDGTFEFVSDPNNSRAPEQNFFVQIKGSHYYTEKDGVVSYSLQSLAFPASVYTNVFLDPGILFVVLNYDQRGEERVFWKYMSTEFVNSIDYSKDSCTIKFGVENEIKNTDESIDEFCKKLEEIIEHHTFAIRLDKRVYSRNDIWNIIDDCNERITECIERLEIYNETRDNVSKRMLKLLKEFCVAVLLLNALSIESEKINLQLAWEYSLLKVDTKYLGLFYRALEYIGYRTPDQGQSERLMLKYYDFLWQIRSTLWNEYGISVLENLEKFPINIHKTDREYYELVANSVENLQIQHYLPDSARFYIQKKNTFYIGKERYYEITLQLAGIYATKFNRITVYTKQNISTNYAIQIAYTDTNINLWGMHVKIKIVTDWKVSIDPVCLNKLGKILLHNMAISSKYREYNLLMIFLTKTGMNLLDLIDLKEIEFEQLIDSIYENSNTEIFKTILLELRKKYGASSTKKGHNVMRYLLLNLREETIEKVIANKYEKKCLTNELYISSSCYPFEKNPFISNLSNSKSNEKNRRKDIIRIGNKNDLEIVFPYLKIQDETIRTGEIYFEKDTIIDEKDIKKFNDSLDFWEHRQGYCLKQNKKYVYIEFYEQTTLFILNKLLIMAQNGTNNQSNINQKFISNHIELFSDPIKKQAVKYAFVNSKILLIYGAAGTGKTTLMNYICDVFKGQHKLFLAKTHTALKNLKVRIDNPGNDADFFSMDYYGNIKKNKEKYDIIFIDECSTIDNRIMKKVLDKVDNDTLLVLAGDFYQIEAIDFGNWFFYAKDVIKTKGANVELTNIWRTKEPALISLWNEVRLRKFMITEKLAIDGPFSAEIGPKLLQREDSDEVVLCLNYDGKFGLNNMNNYFQAANQGRAVNWGEWTYKEGDQILFNDSKRFPILHNNLKGRIVRIEKVAKEEISFTIKIDLLLTEEECEKNNIEFVDSDEKSTKVRITIFRYDANTIKETEEEETRMKAVIPFQLAYAVSIHKAQGLEYKSVKIVIPESNSEKITHGIFYTAITRAKEKLKIYWSSETMKKIVESFSAEESRQKSLQIIKSKLEV